MEIKVKCSDWRYSTRNHIKLVYDEIYTVIAMRKGRKTDQKFVVLKEFPDVEYLARRFKIIDKKIVINLPDDFDKLPNI